MHSHYSILFCHPILTIWYYYTFNFVVAAARLDHWDNEIFIFICLGVCYYETFEEYWISFHLIPSILQVVQKISSYVSWMSPIRPLLTSVFSKQRAEFFFIEPLFTRSRNCLEKSAYVEHGVDYFKYRGCILPLCLVDVAFMSLAFWSI